MPRDTACTVWGCSLPTCTSRHILCRIAHLGKPFRPRSCVFSQPWPAPRRRQVATSFLCPGPASFVRCEVVAIGQPKWARQSARRRHARFGWSAAGGCSLTIAVSIRRPRLSIGWNQISLGGSWTRRWSSEVFLSWRSLTSPPASGRVTLQSSLLDDGTRRVRPTGSRQVGGARQEQGGDRCR